MDLDNINDHTIELITNAVIKKMLYKFKQEYHQMSTPMSVGDLMKGFMPFRETEEEFLLAEMARLHTLLALYEGKEEFMKAAIIKRRLEIVQTKLDNLDVEEKKLRYSIDEHFVKISRPLNKYVHISSLDKPLKILNQKLLVSP